MSFKRDKKEEEDSGGNPYDNLDKTIVLQEAKHFNETHIKPRKCSHILSKIVYLLNQGETFSTREATDAFFATTKLFQSKDKMLRRMVYLCIKELSQLAQDVIIVTSSLTKDMTGKEDLYRAAAIRALCSITDSTMMQAIERYMKQAIVDKNPAVSSAALVSALHLSFYAPDIVRRWASEAQEAVNSENALVSYHALGILATTRKHDKLSIVKLVARLAKSSLKSPYALCLLIRLAAKLVENDNTVNTKPYLDFIEFCLRHKSEMVIYEAAHALVNLRNSARELAPAVSVLQLFCGSSKATLRLAGARTLAKLTEKHPTSVSACTIDLENLISDPNKSVATLAVTTLLATGAESSIDRLMKQISSFVSEISDEFKIIVVKAIRRLCQKFPKKHQSLTAFLAGMLRDEGGLEYKAAIADAIIALVEENEDAKETGLGHLCEFIEDCEHPALAVRILHILGREGPKSYQPSRYIRFIYNRVILETGPVRAAAVSAVAQFGAQSPELLPNIKILLARCELDEEDEVRDRAVFYNAILNSGDQQVINDFIIDVYKPNPDLLEKAIRDHIATKPDELFDITKVPTGESKEKKENVVEVPKPRMMSIDQMYTEQLKRVPGIEKLGPLFKRNAPIDLTEPETEYRVRLVKHIFVKHVIFQFECTNTLNDQILEQVHVSLECPPEYEIKSILPCQKLVYDKPDSVYVVVEFPCAVMDSLGIFRATLEFVVRDCDPNTGEPDPGEGYADTYRLEEFFMTWVDQMKNSVIGDNWKNIWGLGTSDSEITDTYELAQNDANEAAISLCECLGFPTDKIEGDAVKEITGRGTFRDGCPFIVRARVAATKEGVTMLICAKTHREDVTKLLLAAVD